MSLRRRIVEIVERHLDEIVDATMAAYRREIPRVAAASPEDLRMMRAATARATQAFLSLYADPVSLAKPMIERARAATVERAGELVELDDIMEMIRIGRRTITMQARAFVARELTVPEDQRVELQAQLDAFLDELERADEVVTRVPQDTLTEWLAGAEKEEPDIR